MKVSQDVSILFHPRYANGSTEGKATISIRLAVNGLPRDGFSLGYQVDPKKLDRKAAAIIGKSL